MGKKYKNESLMQIFTILGGIVGLVSVILGFSNLPTYGFVDALVVLDRIVLLIIGIAVAIITLWAGLKPNNPIPFHLLVLLILGILLIVFGGGIWAGVLLIIAFLIGLIEHL